MNSQCRSDYKWVVCKFRRRQFLNWSRQRIVLLCDSCQRMESWEEVYNPMKGGLVWWSSQENFEKMCLHLGIILAHSCLWSPSTWMNISLIWPKSRGHKWAGDIAVHLLLLDNPVIQILQLLKLILTPLICAKIVEKFCLRCLVSIQEFILNSLIVTNMVKFLTFSIFTTSGSLTPSPLYLYTL